MSLLTPSLRHTRPQPAARPGERVSALGVPLHPMLLILAISAVLRFWQLGAAPILYFDSGAYLGEGRFLASAAARSVDALVHPAPGAPGNPVARVVEATASGTEGHPPDLAKPGNSILLALAILALGPTTLAAGVVPALAGLGTIAGTYALGSLLWNRRVAVVGAILLAFSTEHLVYSREPLVESTGLLFATLATLVYARSVLDARGGSLRELCAAGALFGLSFACNNRLAYLPVSLGLLELMVWRRNGWRRWPWQVRRAAALCGGFVAPLVVIEASFLGAQAVAYSAGATPGFLDYAHQFVNFVRMNPTSRARLDQWPTFFVDLGLMDGLALLGLFLFGGALMIARRSRSRCDLIVAAFLVVPLVLFTVYSSGEIRMRNFSYVLPWVMLVAASGIWWIADRLRYSRLLGATAIGVLVLLALPRDLAVISAPSAVPDLLAALQSNGNPRVASTNGPVLSYYLGEDRTNARLREAFINTDTDLAQITTDYPYVVVDMQGYWSPGPVTDAAARAVPVFQEPNGNDVLFLADVLESQGTAWGDWRGLLERWNRDRGSATLLRLYRSSDLSAATVGNN